MDRLFSHKSSWSILNYCTTYTAGLHSNERAHAVESFVKTQHKVEHSIKDLLVLVKKLEPRDCVLECNSKEAHSYFTHPVYQQIRNKYTPYAQSLMLH